MLNLLSDERASPVSAAYFVSASAPQPQAVPVHFATIPARHPWGRVNSGFSPIVRSPLSPPPVRAPVTETLVMSPPDRRATVCPPVHADFGDSPSFTLTITPSPAARHPVNVFT